MSFLKKLQNLSDKNKKIILWTIIAVIAVVMLFFWVGGFMNSVSKIGQVRFLPDFSTPEDYAEDNSLENSTESLTADWQTYKSEIYGYEINFPPKYQVKSAFVSPGVSDLEMATFVDQNYAYTFQVFAREQDRIGEDCLNDLTGNPLINEKEINGEIFYAFKDKQPVLANKDSIAGSLESSYHILHNNQCYFVTYNVTPMNYQSNTPATQFRILEDIFLTFKFTK